MTVAPVEGRALNSGARTHNTKSGNAHYMGSDEEDALEYVKALLSFLPQNNLDEPPGSI